VSRPPARHEKTLRSPARFDLYNEPRYDDARYLPAPSGTALCTEAPHHDNVRYRASRYGEARYGARSYDADLYDAGSYNAGSYDAGSYDAGSYNAGSYNDALYGASRHDGSRHDGSRHGEAQYGSYDDGSYEEDLYDELYDDGAYREVPYDERGYAHDAAERRRPPGGRGAHRRARPPKMRRKPVRIAAVMAGSTLLVAGAAPVAAHWWHRLATHPTALDQNSPPTTPSVALGAQNSRDTAASHNALDQWAQIPIGKHAAAQARAAKRAARHAAAQPSHSPPPQPTPTATASAAYQNPLRAVSDLVLERVDQGVDFGGAGPVYALGDGVITNATDQSSGWPGGGWITYQLTDGPDAGLVVYLAEDVTPTVQVGQQVTSSTVIANMFNGGDGIETGWATSDSSTAESQMAAAGGISGGGPFPTMVGLSFDAVLESVGVPAAPNANEPGNGLLPAGYPPVAG
jgi:hypothetical protein